MEPRADAAAVRHPRVFISYSSQDRKFAARVHAELSADGFDTCLAELHLRHMDHWPSNLAQELAGRDVLLLLWSNNAAQSDYVRAEWLVSRALGKGIVVCLLDEPQALHTGNELPADLGRYHSLPSAAATALPSTQQSETSKTP